YRLDSVTTFTIKAGQRRAFHLNCNACTNSHTLTWLESVGNLGDLVYPYSINAQGPPNFWSCISFPDAFSHDFDHFLTCFDHAEKVYFDSCIYSAAMSDPCFLVEDSCSYHGICGAVEDHQRNNRLHVFPNPAEDQVTISIDHSYT